jgi:hypothetical protein
MDIWTEIRNDDFLGTFEEEGRILMGYCKSLGHECISIPFYGNFRSHDPHIYVADFLLTNQKKIRMIIPYEYLNNWSINQNRKEKLDIILND